jgi:hypothetical protein
MTMAERNDERIAPVALPAGQFELGDLQKALDTAVSVKDREKHSERIIKAIADTIKNPELLVAGDLPALPMGAELVEQDVTYVDGEDPVTRHVPAFTKVKAESGEEAASMRYAEPTAVEAAEEDVPATLADQAAERIADETNTSSSKAGGTSNNK